MSKRIVLASNNQNKVREFNQILKDHAFEILPLSKFSGEEVAETGLSFVENAIIKARHATKVSGLPAFADDSGLEVDALKGAPGIYSARFAGPGATDKQNLTKLLLDMKDVPMLDRSARFQCVIVYMEHENDPVPLIFHGTWDGHILLNEQGSNGFGYDPVFGVAEKQCSAAELAASEKNQLSHRGKALRQMVNYMSQNFAPD